MCKQYVLASANPGKLREITAKLEPLGYSIRPQADWQVPQVLETGRTFLENALAKARQAVRYTQLPSIADDSGLVVPALNGEPGIFSARYCGEGAGDRANIHRLLKQLDGVTGKRRCAYFYCCMVLLSSEDDPAPLLATANWYGEILHSPRGENGFGYDPVFAVAGTQYSAAELSLDDKQCISHRGQALDSLLTQIRERNGKCS